MHHQTLIPMAAKLIAEEGLLKDLVLSFEEGEQWVIGRDPDACQLLVEDPSASRKHALCRRVDQGIVIENLSTTNPVLVNDEKLIEPRLLQHGDTVRIGNSIFSFYTETEAHLYEAGAPHAANNQSPPSVEKPHDTILEQENGENHGGVAHVNFDLLETGRWLLKVISGPNTGAEFSMQAGNSYIIGTDPNTCDIVFYDTSVSRQHGKLTVNPDDTIMIEDLKSRNGTRIDGELITTQHPLTPNTIVSMGTTSFVVYDREGEMQTIISPLMPSIVKVLKKEEAAQEAAQAEAKKAEASKAEPKPAEPAKHPHAVGTFFISAILIGLFAIVGIAVQTLFVQEPVVMEQTVNSDKILQESLSPFPSVKYSFNKSTGRLLLVGHVLAASDKSQLLYNLQGMPFIKDIDDTGVIIDEYVWGEANQILTKHADWKGITVYAPTPGQFVVTGYLQTNDQWEQVWDYLTRNFPYLDHLENKIVVEETILSTVSNALYSKGFNNISAQMSAGELIISGNVAEGKKADMDALVATFKDIPGIRFVRNLTSERPPAESLINISDKYIVSGVSHTDAGKVNVIINGRILTLGDVIDGMRITAINPNYVLLEKEGVMYRIDYSK